MGEADDVLFWDLANEHIAAGAERSTMMGLPCLRLDGVFYASADRKTGDLIVKLPAARVDELIDTGMGSEFAPAGRRFKEWVQLPGRDERLWRDLLEEARAKAAVG